MSCEICELIEKKENIIYEDEKIIALLHPKPCTVGHIILMPKKHIPILEQIHEDLFADLIKKANKISSAIFESMQPQGTNIFIQNGLAAGQKFAHVIVNIIPRKQGDGINLEWTPKKVEKEELSTLEKMIKDILVSSPEPEKIEEIDDDEINYLIEHLKRIP